MKIFNSNDTPQVLRFEYAEPERGETVEAVAFMLGNTGVEFVDKDGVTYTIGFSKSGGLDIRAHGLGFEALHITPRSGNNVVVRGELWEHKGR